MRIRRSIHQTRTLLGLCVALGCLLASASAATFTGRERANTLRVRPCTTEEGELASLPEIAHVFNEQTADNRPPFPWCEALDVEWLPAATILRFHTAIHTDYAYTYTLLRAKPGDTLFVTQFGEGLVGGNTSRKLPGVVKALNELLNYSAPNSVMKSHFETACVLFLFLVGRENRTSLFRRPESKHLVNVSDYKPTLRTIAGQRVVSLRTRTAEWRFTFSLNRAKVNLASVNESSGG